MGRTGPSAWCRTSDEPSSHRSMSLVCLYRKPLVPAPHLPSLARTPLCGLAHLEWGVGGPLSDWLSSEGRRERGGPWLVATAEPELPPGQTHDCTDGSASLHKRPLSFPSYQTHTQRVWDPGGMSPRVAAVATPPPCLEGNCTSQRSAQRASPGARLFRRNPCCTPLVPCRPVSHPRSQAWQGPSLATWGALCRPPWSRAQSLSGLVGLLVRPMESPFGGAGAGRPAEACAASPPGSLGSRLPAVVRGQRQPQARPTPASLTSPRAGWAWHRTVRRPRSQSVPRSAAAPLFSDGPRL